MEFTGQFPRRDYEEFQEFQARVNGRPMAKPDDMDRVLDRVWELQIASEDFAHPAPGYPGRRDQAETIDGRLRVGFWRGDRPD